MLTDYFVQDPLEWQQMMQMQMKEVLLGYIGQDAVVLIFLKCYLLVVLLFEMPVEKKKEHYVFVERRVHHHQMRVLS